MLKLNIIMSAKVTYMFVYINTVTMAFFNLFKQPDIKHVYRNNPEMKGR